MLKFVITKTCIIITSFTYSRFLQYLKIFNKTNEYSMNKSFLKCFNRCICNTIRYSYTLMNAIEIEETSVNYCATTHTSSLKKISILNVDIKVVMVNDNG